MSTLDEKNLDELLRLGSTRLAEIRAKIEHTLEVIVIEFNASADAHRSQISRCSDGKPYKLCTLDAFPGWAWIFSIHSSTGLAIRCERDSGREVCLEYTQGKLLIQKKRIEEIYPLMGPLVKEFLNKFDWLVDQLAPIFRAGAQAREEAGAERAREKPNA